MIRFAAAIVALAFSICACAGLSDIRPPSAMDPTPQAQAEGRALLDRVAQQAGLERWKQVNGVDAKLRDVTESFLAKLFFLNYDEDQALSLHVERLDLSELRLTMQGGDKDGETWGFNGGRLYVEREGERRPEEDNLILLYALTPAAMLGLPFRLAWADQAVHIGTRVIEGRRLEGVLLSWKTLAPQSDVDQWIAWIDPGSAQIVHTEFTVRQFDAGTRAVYSYADYADFDGIQVPKTIIARFGLGEDVVHTFYVEEVQWIRHAGPASQPASARFIP